jgi:hypothetical protein
MNKDYIINVDKQFISSYYDKIIFYEIKRLTPTFCNYVYKRINRSINRNMTPLLISVYTLQNNIYNL